MAPGAKLYIRALCVFINSKKSLIQNYGLINHLVNYQNRFTLESHKVTILHIATKLMESKMSRSPNV